MDPTTNEYVLFSEQFCVDIRPTFPEERMRPSYTIYSLSTAMAIQTKKERNTQRRKRKLGAAKKAHLLGMLCNLDVALIIYNPENRQYDTYRSTDRESWPLPMEQIVSSHRTLQKVSLFDTCQLAHPTSQNKLPEDMERIISKKNERETHPAERKELSRAEVPSDELESEGQTLDKSLHKGRDVPLLPKPPSFDQTLLEKGVRGT
ncbi:MAG: hypothetical protein M1839_004371 [Geoglossum umbratile]|nr:MAG: hypothetical protein M1839_004371 [Geoglossum umbratile]